MLAHPHLIAKGNASPVALSGADPATDRLFVRPGLYSHFSKRLVDLALVGVSLPFVVPLIAAFSLLLLVTGNAPFYGQERVGKHGRRFVMWKLRTMGPDADKQLRDHLAKCPEARREWGVHQKLKNDPRVLPVGRLMRKLSIDELPQVLNVVLGHMSIVGPRPILPEQQPLYPGVAYYAIRPGLTGYWQVSDRHNSSFTDRANYDAAYAKDISFGTDIRVIASTVSAVLRGTGC